MEATGCLGSAGRDFIKIKVRRYNEDENTGTWPLLKLTENSPDKFHHFGLRLLIYRGKLTPMRGELSKTRTGTVLPNDLPDKPNRRRLSRWTISDRILSLFSLEICNKQHFRAPRSVVFRFVKLSILISVPLPRLNKEECCIRLRNQHSCTHTHTRTHTSTHTLTTSLIFRITPKQIAAMVCTDTQKNKELCTSHLCWYFTPFSSKFRF